MRREMRYVVHTQCMLAYDALHVTQCRFRWAALRNPNRDRTPNPDSDPDSNLNPEL